MLTGANGPQGRLEVNIGRQILLTARNYTGSA